MKTIVAVFALLFVAILSAGCSPHGQAIRKGALTVFLIAQEKYCEQPEEIRLILRRRLEEKGIKVEIDCEKGKDPCLNH